MSTNAEITLKCINGKVEDWYSSVELTFCNINRARLSEGETYIFESGNISNSKVDTVRFDISLIERIPNKIMETFEQFKALWITNSNLRTISGKLFEELTPVEVLNLPHNGIETIHMEAFDKLINLRRLNVANNSLFCLGTYFENNPNIVYLDFRNNPISQIDTHIFDSTPNLFEVEFGDNKCINSSFSKNFDAESEFRKKLIDGLRSCNRNFKNYINREKRSTSAAAMACRRPEICTIDIEKYLSHEKVVNFFKQKADDNYELLIPDGRTIKFNIDETAVIACNDIGNVLVLRKSITVLYSLSKETHHLYFLNYLITNISTVCKKRSLITQCSILIFCVVCKYQNVSGRLKDSDSEDHFFAGASLVFPEIDGVNFKNSIFFKYLG